MDRIGIVEPGVGWKRAKRMNDIAPLVDIGVVVWCGDCYAKC